MKRVRVLIFIGMLLFACSPGDAGETTVRILADRTPMFRGDQTIVYDEVETLLAIDTQCVELEVGSFGVQGVPVDLGLLECDEYTGWVHLQHYRYE